ncbi:hypothetical protein DVH24_020609, partial [Malus domestica]
GLGLRIPTSCFHTNRGAPYRAVPSNTILAALSPAFKLLRLPYVFESTADVCVDSRFKPSLPFTLSGSVTVMGESKENSNGRKQRVFLHLFSFVFQLPISLNFMYLLNAFFVLQNVSIFPNSCTKNQHYLDHTDSTWA